MNFQDFKEKINKEKGNCISIIGKITYKEDKRAGYIFATTGPTTAYISAFKRYTEKEVDYRKRLIEYAMASTKIEEWDFELLEVVSNTEGQERKKHYIKLFKTEAMNGGLNQSVLVGENFERAELNLFVSKRGLEQQAAKKSREKQKVNRLIEERLSKSKEPKGKKNSRNKLGF